VFFERCFPVTIDARKYRKGEIGKEHAVKNAKIRSAINRAMEINQQRYRLKEVKLRKMMSIIRTQGLVLFLCSSSKGYYIARTKDEVLECIHSLEQRIRTQQEVVDALKKQSQINMQ